MLQYVLDRLARLDVLSETIVATSTDPSDDPIDEFCRRIGSSCFRGSLDNVAERFLQAARAHRLSAFVRISGDSPLLDQRLVARGVALFAESAADLATNVFPRTYPPGMSVEVVRTETFERIVPELVEHYDREHVTNYFYRHADRFRIESFALDVPRRDVHLAVDTPEHFETVSRIVSAMTRPPADYSLEDVLRLCDDRALHGAPAPAPTQVQP